MSDSTNSTNSTDNTDTNESINESTNDEETKSSTELAIEIGIKVAKNDGVYLKKTNTEFKAIEESKVESTHAGDNTMMLGISNLTGKELVLKQVFFTGTAVADLVQTVLYAKVEPKVNMQWYLVPAGANNRFIVVDENNLETYSGYMEGIGNTKRVEVCVQHWGQEMAIANGVDNSEEILWTFFIGVLIISTPLLLWVGAKTVEYKKAYDMYQEDNLKMNFSYFSYTLCLLLMMGFWILAGLTAIVFTPLDNDGKIDIGISPTLLWILGISLIVVMSIILKYFVGSSVKKNLSPMKTHLSFSIFGVAILAGAMMTVIGFSSDLGGWSYLITGAIFLFIALLLNTNVPEVQPFTGLMTMIAIVLLICGVAYDELHGQAYAKDVEVDYAMCMERNNSSNDWRWEPFVDVNDPLGNYVRSFTCPMMGVGCGCVHAGDRIKTMLWGSKLMGNEEDATAIDSVYYDMVQSSKKSCNAVSMNDCHDTGCRIERDDDTGRLVCAQRRNLFTKTNDEIAL